eukprot:scaffold2237_cov175-Ochromonas_danica.AAC.24
MASEEGSASSNGEGGGGGGGSLVVLRDCRVLAGSASTLLISSYASPPHSPWEIFFYHCDLYRFFGRLYLNEAKVEQEQEEKEEGSSSNSSGGGGSMGEGFLSMHRLGCSISAVACTLPSHLSPSTPQYLLERSMETVEEEVKEI